MQLSPFVFYLSLGVILISSEILFLGLSVFWLLFIGVGSLIAAIYAWLVPDATWLTSTVIFVVSSVLISVGLYKPLKNWQSKPSVIPGNDAINKKVKVIRWSSSEKKGKVSYSGATWTALQDSGSEELKEGDEAIITSMQGIELTIAKREA